MTGFGAIQIRNGCGNLHGQKEAKKGVETELTAISPKNIRFPSPSSPRGRVFQKQGPGNAEGTVGFGKCNLARDLLPYGAMSGMRWGWIFFFLARAWLPGAAVSDPCATTPAGSFFVTDRFLDGVSLGQWLILANGHGLVFKDLSSSNLETFAVVEVPGQVTELRVSGTQILALSQNAGVFVYDVGDNLAPLRNRRFIPVTGARTMAVSGNRLVVAADRELLGFDLNRRSLSLAPKTVGNVQKLEMNADALVFRLDDSRVGTASHGGDSISEPHWVSLDGQEAFYNFELMDDLVILDAPLGIRYALIDAEGMVLQDGMLWRNQGAQVALGLAAADERVFVRFATRFTVFDLSGPGVWRERGSAELDLSVIRIPKMLALDDRLLLLNATRKNRPWSLALYEVVGDALQQRNLLPSRLEELSGVARVGDHVYFAVDDRILFHPVDQIQGLADPDDLPAHTLGGNINEIAAEDSLLFILSSDAQQNNGLMTAFRVLTSGDLELVWESVHVGSLQDLRVSDAMVSYVEYYRDAEMDHYEAHLADFNDPTQPTLQSHSMDVNIGDTHPFQDLQIQQGQLYYHNGLEVFRHPIKDLSDVTSQSLPSGKPIRALALSQGAVWVETDDGLLVFEDRHGSLHTLGDFPQWRELTQTRNGYLFCRNQNVPIPGQFELLELDEDNLVFPRLSVASSGSPSFFLTVRNPAILAETVSVNLLQLQCNPLNYHYDIPFDSSASLEINTDMGDEDLIRIEIGEASGRTIGMPLLRRESLSETWGGRVNAWFQQYDQRFVPHTLSLSSTFPLAPVISRRNTHSTSASRVPEIPSATLFLPHVADPDGGWTSVMWIRNQAEIDPVRLAFQNPLGEAQMVDVNAGFTESFGVADLFSERSAWVELQTLQTSVAVNGFAIYSRGATQDSAAVPLIGEPSEFLAIPHLIGKPGTWWTGLALSNPNPQPVRARVIGYDPRGDIAVDRDIQVEPLGQFLAVLEAWLHLAFSGLEVEWLVLVADQPVMGVLLLGHSTQGTLAGLSLNADTSRKLVFPGIRQFGSWNSELLFVNREAAQGSLSLRAIDVNGITMAQTEITLQQRQKAKATPSTLFPALTTEELALVKTVVAQADVDLTGVILRTHDQAKAMDAYYALPVSLGQNPQGSMRPLNKKEREP